MGINAISHLAAAKDHLAQARIVNKQEIEERTVHNDFESQYVMHLEDIQESLENAYILTVEAYKKAFDYSWYKSEPPKWIKLLKGVFRAATKTG